MNEKKIIFNDVRSGKHSLLLQESIKQAQKDKIVLYASLAGDVVLVPKEKYEELLKLARQPGQ